MNVEDLSPKRRQHYESVTKYFSKHPEASVKEAAKATGADVSAYYAAKAFLKDGVKPYWKSKDAEAKPKRKYKKRDSKMFTLPVDEGTHHGEKAFLLIGSTKDLVSAIKELGVIK